MENSKKPPGSRVAIVKRYRDASADVQRYFEYLPRLIEEDFPLNICISYRFARTEQAQNELVYYGVVKLHGGEKELTRNAVQKWRVDRQKFGTMFKTIYGKPVKSSIVDALEEAKQIRDDVMHGKEVTEKEKRQAIVDVIDYADDLNEFVKSIAGFRPFGDMRGYKGRTPALDKSTTRWMLKGIGFELG